MKSAECDARVFLWVWIISNWFLGRLRESASVYENVLGDRTFLFVGFLAVLHAFHVLHRELAL